MRYLTITELLALYRRLMQRSGGAPGLRSLGALQTALAQPRMTFDGEELYPTIAEKTSALGFTLLRKSPFAEGNERAAHAAMALFLALNGYALAGDAHEQAQIILQTASGESERDDLTVWLHGHIVKRSVET
jgi:death-on-curing protein